VAYALTRQVLVQLDLGSFGRAELLSALRELAAAADIRLAAHCIGFAQNERQVKALLSDGTSLEGDLLLGADGLHSVVRAQLLGATKPGYAGYIAWRGVSQFEHQRISSGISAVSSARCR
jgi:2-polyprenyl-6-methoxyphenol hydroxylase-like FAD-dependent oxidoreductase